MPQSQFNLSCLSRRGFIHSYMLKTSMTMSTYLYPLFHLLTCCMSTKSAGNFFLLIFIVDNHAYWFVVVLSFVLSRYKELIKLSLKKNASPRLRDWRLVFTWQNQMQNTNSACDSVPYNSRFHVLLGIPRVNPNVQLHGVFSMTLTQLITLT